MATEPDLEVKYARNTKDLVDTAILLSILVLLLILFRIYVCIIRRHHRRHHPFSPDPFTTTTTTLSKEERLDPSILKSLPTFTYSSSTTSSRQLHDCAVCLSEFSDGDECRTLPNCNHGFHSHCIDKWFASNSNCPLCRTPVRPVTVQSGNEPGDVSVLEAGEGCSQFPEPIGCPRKPLRIIVELPGEDSGSGTEPENNGFKCTLKRLCNV